MTESGAGESATTVDPTEESPNGEESSHGADEQFADLDAGAGCTEIWEHLSEQREAGDD